MVWPITALQSTTCVSLQNPLLRKTRAFSAPSINNIYEATAVCMFALRCTTPTDLRDIFAERLGAKKNVCLPHLVESLGMLPVDVLLTRYEEFKRISQSRDHQVGSLDVALEP